MQETCIQSLGHQDPLEKEMATHFSILAWEIPWTEKPGRLQSMGSQRVGHDLAATTTLIFFTVFIKGAYLSFFFFVCISIMDFWLVDTMRFFFLTFIYFIWLCQVYFPDQGLNQGPCVGSVES